MKALLFLFLIGCVAQASGPILTEEKILATPSKKPGVFRIMLFGPGLNHSGIVEGSSPAQLLEKELNSECKNCYEVINGSLPGNFSTKSLILLEKLPATTQPDLAVYYESGYFIASEMLERYHYNYDEDLELPVPKSEAELYKNSCCETIMSVLPEGFRKRISVALNYASTFKDSKGIQRRDLITLSADFLRNFSRMNFPVTKDYKRKALVLLHPLGFKADRFVFEEDPVQQILFKFLIFFYAPDKFPIRKVFHNQGFPVARLGDQLNDLYTPQYLMHRHPYNLNSAGIELWSRSASFSIKRYLKNKEELRYDDN